MRRHHATAFAVIPLAIGLLVSTASALSLESKNKKGSVCSARWELTGDTGLVATKQIPGSSKFDCTDGSDCDADGAVNDSCTITLTACAAPVVDGCTPQPVTEFKFAPAKKIALLSGFGAPPTGVTEETCGTPGTVVLPLKVKANGTKKPSKFFTAKMTFKDEGKGKSKVKVRCVPCEGGDCGGGGTTTTTIDGGGCPEREASGLPKQIAYNVPGTGSDLDNGWSGSSHNFPVVNGSTLTYCLSDCDATTDPECVGHGPTGEGSINGRTFGPPLPLLASNVPVCVINVFQSDFEGNINLQTGEASSDVLLFAETHTPTPSDEICPRCLASGGIGSTGTCSNGARRAGQSCTVEGLVTVPLSGGSPEYKLSGDCLPPASVLAGTLDIRLPLTTGESRLEGRVDGERPCDGPNGVPEQDDSCGGGTCTGGCAGPSSCATTDDMGRCIDAKGGISQVCCSNNTGKPCFPTAPDSAPNAIIRTGTPMIPQPAWPDPTYPKTVEGNVFAATFCEAATDSNQVNLVTGLPGPAALLLPGDAVVTVTE